MTRVHVPKVREVTVRQEGDRVLLLEGGRTVLELPWDAAVQLSKAILAQARKAEELVKAEQIIADQALLTRLGTPLGLTNNPAMLKAAANEAAWNRDLRRRVPLKRAGGIKSGAVFGTPKLIMHKKGADNGEKEH